MSVEERGDAGDAGTVESQPGGRAGWRKGASRGRMVPFLFCIILMFNKGVEGGEARSISGYDNPKNSKIWDASTRCKEQAERKLEEERGQVQLRDVQKNVFKIFR